MAGRRISLFIAVSVGLIAGLATWYHNDCVEGARAERLRRAKTFWRQHGFWAGVDGGGKLLALSTGRRITEADAQAFNASVEVDAIVIRDHEFSDDGLRYIARCGRVGELDISGTDVTDKGLDYVAKIKGLEELDAVNSLITPEAIQRFRESRPRVHVMYSQRPPGPFRHPTPY